MTKAADIELRGVPITLDVYEGAGTITNRHFDLSRCLGSTRSTSPRVSSPSPNAGPVGSRELLIDDNRSAVDRRP